MKYFCILMIAAALFSASAQEKTITVEVREPQQTRVRWACVIGCTIGGKKDRIKLPVLSGKLLDIQASSSFAGTVANIPPPSCLNSWWCSIIFPPTNTAVYNTVVWYVVEGPDNLSYLARDDRAGRMAEFTVNAPVSYAVHGDTLFLIAEAGKPRPLVIVKKVLRDPTANSPHNPS